MTQPVDNPPRFNALWERNCTGAVCAMEVYQRIASLYASAGRYYHVMEHIDYCLSLFDQVADQCKVPDAVELAIWFHDVIYDVKASDNELQSAEYFLQSSADCMLESQRQRVFDLIIATEHKNVPEDWDQALLVDIDLSSFGLTWERFKADGMNVRKEMHHLSDSAFYAGQRDFMTKLCSRRPLYNHQSVRAGYEQQARVNISRYLIELAERGF